MTAEQPQQCCPEQLETGEQVFRVEDPDGGLVDLHVQEVRAGGRHLVQGHFGKTGACLGLDEPERQLGPLLHVRDGGGLLKDLAVLVQESTTEEDVHPVDAAIVRPAYHTGFDLLFRETEAVQGVFAREPLEGRVERERDGAGVATLLDHLVD